jgi:hypothetical protein
MFKTRHIDIHRKSVSSKEATFITLPEVEGKISYMKFETNSKDTKELKDTLNEFFKNIPDNSSIKPSINKETIWILEKTNYELIKSCDHYFSLLQKFVSETHERWLK